LQELKTQGVTDVRVESLPDALASNEASAVSNDLQQEKPNV
jgi:hypothetical protein